jgi:hypothetical protein
MEEIMADETNNTTDLARLLEAMRRDAVDAEEDAYLEILAEGDGMGWVRWDGGERATFETIEAGVARLKSIIDDAEEG